MKPTFQILVSGEDRTADITGRGMIIEWTDGVEEKADTLSISIADTGGAIGIPVLGAKIELSVGYNFQLERVGSYTIETAEIEGPPARLTVSATAAPVAQAGSIAARRSKSWEDTTLGDIAKSIAGNLASNLAIDPALAAVAIPNAQQVDESDTNFLLRLVRKHGGYLKFADGRMVIAAEGTGTGAGGASLTVPLQRYEISKWKFSAGGKGQALKKVKVKYHKYETGETAEVEAEIKQSASAQGISEDAEWLATTESAFVHPTTAASEEDAKAQAKTAAKRIGSKTRTFEIELPGRLDIVAGGKVNLQGLRDGMDGEWLVKEVRHRLDDNGWSMTASGEGA